MVGRKVQKTYNEEFKYATYAIKRKPLHFWVAQGKAPQAVKDYVL